MDAHGIRPRKSRGQNFLCDRRIPHLLAERASWPRPATLCEIGAGGGALTTRLLSLGHRVCAIEIDRDLVALLQRRFAPEIVNERLFVIEGNFLDLAPEILLAPLDRLDAGAPRETRWLAGNLPYGLTTAMLLRALALRRHFGGAVFMVQREYGERLVAREGSREYGSLSVWTAAHARARLILRVDRSAFWPRPGVESVVVELDFSDPPPFQGEYGKLERVLRASFGQRRKMLINSLAHGLGLEKEVARVLLEQAGCSPEARAETLTLDQFARLSEGLAE